jgi:hypothetical protein
MKETERKNQLKYNFQKGMRIFWAYLNKYLKHYSMWHKRFNSYTQIWIPLVHTVFSALFFIFIIVT